MGRSERRDYFERLCALRNAYGSRPDDQRGVLSVEDVMIYAEAVMLALDDPEWDEVDVANAGNTGAERAAQVDAVDRDPGRRAATDAILGPSETAIELVQFDGTGPSIRIRRIDLPGLGPRSDGASASDADGWRHLGVFLDRFGPAAGDRLD
ncbi:MAG: hypothetical protein QOI09_2622 [Chloroflexota bacterium]|jgi:hypothetical protein|nr:hypothetical protein [Chloroflexota bacterium]